MEHMRGDERGHGLADDDQSQLIRLRHGDSTAFETIFRTYYPQLVRLATRYLNRRDRAEEIVQDVLLKIWERRATLQIEGTLVVYLYSAVRNESLKRIQRDEREQGWIASESTTLPEYAIVDGNATGEGDELAVLVTRAMESLPSRCREVFRIYREHDLNSSEIAAILNISPATVRVQLARAMHKLRDTLRDFRSL